MALSSFLTSTILPVPSTCPDTMCPPNLPSAAIARSKLTCAPLSAFASDERFSVSCMTSAVNACGMSLVTVRQIPFTAMLSPTFVPASTFSALIVRTAEFAPREIVSIVPTSSTIPVNIVYRLSFLSIHNITLDEEIITKLCHLTVSKHHGMCRRVGSHSLYRSFCIRPSEKLWCNVSVYLIHNPALKG